MGIARILTAFQAERRNPAPKHTLRARPGRHPEPPDLGRNNGKWRFLTFYETINNEDS